MHKTAICYLIPWERMETAGTSLVFVHSILPRTGLVSGKCSSDLLVPCLAPRWKLKLCPAPKLCWQPPVNDKCWHPLWEWHCPDMWDTRKSCMIPGAESPMLPPGYTSDMSVLPCVCWVARCAGVPRDQCSAAPSLQACFAKASELRLQTSDSCLHESTKKVPRVPPQLRIIHLQLCSVQLVKMSGFIFHLAD